MYFDIPIDIYKRGVSVYVGEDKTNLADWLNHLEDDKEVVKKAIEENADAQALTITLKADVAVYVPLEPSSAKNISILCHELFHATTRILAFVDIEPSRESEEAYTYLHEYLCKQCFDELGLEFITKQTQ